MAFPASIAQLPHRKRVRQPKTPRTHTEYPEDIDPGDGGGGFRAVGGPGGPVLDFGDEGGVKLRLNNGRWRWEWANQHHPHLTFELGDEPKLLFPSTAGSAPKVRYMDERVNSARYHLSEVLDDTKIDREFFAFGADLGLEHLDQVVQVSETEGDYDVFLGPTLAVVHNPRGTLVRTFTCSPFGEIGQHLSVSAVIPPSIVRSQATAQTTFVPIATPCASFQTGILQICPSPCVSTRRDRHGATAILVRIHACTQLLSLSPNPTYSPPTDQLPSEVQIVGILSAANTDGLRHVDVALHHSVWGTSLIVDESGSVWLWRMDKIERGERSIDTFLTRKIYPGQRGKSGGFFRVAFGTREGTAILMSRTQIITIDYDRLDLTQDVVEAVGDTLVDLEGRGRFFTCLEKTAAERDASYIVACTSHEVMWLDELKMGIPRMSWSHHYGSGRILSHELAVVKRDAEECILLSSRHHPMVIAFHVPSDPPIRSLVPPYPLRINQQPDGPLHSFAYLKVQRHSKDAASTTLVLGISTTGALWSVPLLNDTRFSESSGEVDRTSRQTTMRIRWSDEAESLAEEAEKAVSERDNSAAARAGKWTEIKGRWAWKEISGLGDDDPPATPAMDEYERYLRELEAPYEHLVTAADVVRDYTHGEVSGSRSSLLRSLSIKEDEMGQIMRADHSKHLSVIRHQPPAIDLAGLLDAFPCPEPASQPWIPQRHRDTARDLATDLALSLTVLGSDAISSLPTASQGPINTPDSDNPDELFARATGALSINDREPQLFRFSYLSPQTHQQDPPGSSDLPGPPKVDQLQSLSARSLMEEWQVGDSPGVYEWTPWLNDTQGVSEPSDTLRRTIKPLPSPRGSGSQAQGRVPPIPASQPTILRSATSIPNFALEQPLRPMARSSPPPMMPQSSLDLGPQTQVERGPFGGRAGVKKKPKKRVGGF